MLSIARRVWLTSLLGLLVIASGQLRMAVAIAQGPAPAQAPGAVSPAAAVQPAAPVPGAPAPVAVPAPVPGSAPAALPGPAPIPGLTDRSPEPYDPYDTGKFNWRHGNISLSALVGVGGTAKMANTPLALDVTLGLMGRVEQPLNPYLIFGGNFGASEWVPTLSSHRGAGRSTLFDFTFLSKLRYPFSDRFEIYLQAPVGFCADLGDSSNFGGPSNFAGGYTVQAYAGMHLGLSPSTGLVLDGGYALHWFTTHVDRSSGVRYTVDTVMRQPTFIIGFYARD